MDEDWPLIAYLSKAKAIKPSNEIQNQKNRKLSKFPTELHTECQKIVGKPDFSFLDA